MGLFGRNRLDRELDDELRFHLERQAEDNRRAGMNPEEARHAAMRSFGGVASMQEQYREGRSFALIGTIAQDIRYALRTMRRDLGFTTVAVVSLALGIGANTAVFTLLDVILLKTLPVRDPARLVQMEQIYNGNAFNFSSWPAIERIRARSHSFEDVFAWSDRRMNVDTGGGAEQIECLYATGNYYRALGVPAVLGRTLLPEDDQAGTPGVAVLSYRLWKARFAGDPNILGRSIRIEGVPVTIVGVLPAWFLGTEVGRSPEIAFPVALQPLLMRDRPMLARPDAQWLRVMARLAGGISEEQARAEMAMAWPQIIAELDPNRKQGIRQMGMRLAAADTGLSQLRDQFSRPLFILMGLVGLLLLMACTNVANLLLARATARRQEMSLRLAIGAGRGRLVRQLLTESLLLAAMSCALGMLIAFWGVRGLASLLTLGRAAVVLNLAPDARVLAFTTLVAAVTALLFGLAPAIRATRVELKTSRRRSTRAFVVIQIASCLLLLTGMGLFVRTLHELLTTNAGFERDGVLLVSLNPARAGYRGAALTQLYRELLDRINALPGVRSASLARYPPVQGSGGTMFSASSVSVDGRQSSSAAGNVYLNTIGPRFFETLGAPLLAGREFNVQDTDRARRVVVVSEAAAREYVGEGVALGHIIRVGSGAPAEIVGVASDVKYETLRESPHKVIYEPYTQDVANAGVVYLEVRSSAGPPSALSGEVRRELRALAGRVPVETITLTEWVDQFLVRERLLALLSSAFGILAFVLATIGLYGVMAYTVARQTGEIGIRMALGAQPAAMRWLVMRDTLLLAVAGIAVGVPAALAAGRFVSSLLFGLTPRDPMTLGLAALLTIGQALLAGYFPARRASRVDPMVALRHE